MVTTRTLRLIALLLALAFTGCVSGLTGESHNDEPFANPPAVDRALGTVSVATEIDGEPFYVLVPDVRPGTAYAPTELPEAFQSGGTRVVFSGELLPIPPNVRMIAQEIILSDITLAP